MGRKNKRASVRILHLGPKLRRVEVECPAGTTGVTMMDGGPVTLTTSRSSEACRLGASTRSIGFSPMISARYSHLKNPLRTAQEW